MPQDISFSVSNNNGDAVRVGAWRYAGDGSGPNVHLQAGVHADEIAGMLVLHLLMQRLQIAEAQGRLKGQVTVVPQANPLGIGQFSQGRILGVTTTRPGTTSIAHSTSRRPWRDLRPASSNGKKNWCNWLPRPT